MTLSVVSKIGFKYLQANILTHAGDGIEKSGMDRFIKLKPIVSAVSSLDTSQPRMTHDSHSPSNSLLGNARALAFGPSSLPSAVSR